MKVSTTVTRRRRYYNQPNTDSRSQGAGVSKIRFSIPRRTTRQQYFYTRKLFNLHEIYIHLFTGTKLIYTRLFYTARSYIVHVRKSVSPYHDIKCLSTSNASIYTVELA
jgi:hypothetical protein